MTEFSKPVALEPLTPPLDTNGSTAIAKIAENVAVVAWTLSDSQYDVALYLTAVRHTPQGPVVGPTLLVEKSANYSAYGLNDIVQGRADEAWLVAEDSGSDGVRRHRFARVTVDYATLAVSYEWKHQWRASWLGNGGFVQAWPTENLLIFGTNNDDYNAASGVDSKFVALIDMDTGTVVSQVQTPLYRPGSTTSTTRVFIKALSFHPSGKLLLVGDWYEDNHAGSGQNWYNAGAWVTDVTPTGIDANWTYAGDLRGAANIYSYYYYTTRWAAAAATQDGWSMLFMSSYSYGRAYWFKILLDGTISWSSSIITYNANSYYDYDQAGVYDVVYDEGTDVAVGAFQQWYSAGLACLEARGADVDYTVQFLPSSADANYVNSAQCCVVSPGNYIFAMCCTGVGRPLSGGYMGTFRQSVWAGGQAMELVANAGGQIGDEIDGSGGTRRSFRRMH